MVYTPKQNQPETQAREYLIHSRSRRSRKKKDSTSTSDRFATTDAIPRNPARKGNSRSRTSQHRRRPEGKEEGLRSLARKIRSRLRKRNGLHLPTCLPDNNHGPRPYPRATHSSHTRPRDTILHNLQTPRGQMGTDLQEGRRRDCAPHPCASGRLPRLGYLPRRPRFPR